MCSSYLKHTLTYTYQSPVNTWQTYANSAVLVMNVFTYYYSSSRPKTGYQKQCTQPGTPDEKSHSLGSGPKLVVCAQKQTHNLGALGSISSVQKHVFKVRNSFAKMCFSPISPILS